MSGDATRSQTVAITAVGKVGKNAGATLSLSTAVTAAALGHVFVAGDSLHVSFGASPGGPTAPGEIVVIAMDKVLRRAPTSLAVSVNGAVAEETLSFKIDGVEVYTADADADGSILEISIPVPDTVDAGTHTVTVDGSEASGEDTFTMERDADAPPLFQGLDTDPVLIPEAHVDGVYRWVLQDLMPEGLGSWVMPINPSSMTSPGVQKTITGQHSTAAVSGQYHLWRGIDMPIEWSFSGFCPDQDFYEQLQAYAAITRRFYIIDHRNRAWKVAITGLDMVARKRRLDEHGVPQDWRHDYTVHAVIYDQTPRTPV
jgi:hypothetical protein